MANKQYHVPIEIAPSTGGGGSGTVTSVGTSGIATGGPITTSGTVTVAGSGNTTTAATAAANLAAAPANDVVTTDGSGNIKDSGTLLASLAPLASPTFTGVPAAPTAAGGTNTTQLATTAFVQSALGNGVIWNNIQNATGTLVLANGTNPTTFQQTASVAWAWQNTAVATSGTTNQSPIFFLDANYWTGAASAIDTWQIFSLLGSGTNAVSTLNLNHNAGTSGNCYVSLGSTASLQFQNSTPAIDMGATASWTLNFTNGSGATNNGNLNVSSGTSLNLVASASNPQLELIGGISTTTAAAVLIENTNNFTGTAGTQKLCNIVGTFAPTSGNATFVANQVKAIVNQTGGASGSYQALLVQAQETALGGSSNFLILAQAGSAGTTTKFSVDNSGNVVQAGKTTNYNNIATVSGGHPAEYAKTDLTAQTAAITATTLYATTATAMYRVSWSAAITTAASISSVLGGTNGFQVIYTSPTDSVVKTTVPGNSVTSAANTTGTAVGGTEVIYAKTGTNIQFSYDYTSSGTAMAFETHITVEQL